MMCLSAALILVTVAALLITFYLLSTIATTTPGPRTRLTPNRKPTTLTNMTEETHPAERISTTRAATRDGRSRNTRRRLTTAPTVTRTTITTTTENITNKPTTQTPTTPAAYSVQQPGGLASLRFPFVCTINIDRYSRNMKLPEDGLCDIIFIDGMYKNGTNTFFTPISNWNPDLLHFLLLEKQSFFRATKIGLGFDTRSNQFYQEFPIDADPSRLRMAINYTNLRFFGLLDINTGVFRNVNPLGDLYYTMNVFFRFLTFYFQNDSGIVVALSPSKSSEFREYLLDIDITRRSPLIFIALSHASYRNFFQPVHQWDQYKDPAYTPPGCFIIPPTISDFPPSVKDYNVTLEEALDLLTYLEANNSGPIIQWAISVTMKARRFSPTSPGPQSLEFFQPCETTTLQDVPPFSVCENNITGQYRYRQDIMSGYFTNTTHVLTFDTEQALKAKLCAAHAIHKDIPFGIAAYDIDADVDQTGSSCQQVEYRANYSRLRLLRRIRDFFKAYFYNQNNLADCDSVT